MEIVVWNLAFSSRIYVLGQVTKLVWVTHWSAIIPSDNLFPNDWRFGKDLLEVFGMKTKEMYKEMYKHIRIVHRSDGNIEWICYQRLQF